MCVSRQNTWEACTVLVVPLMHVYLSCWGCACLHCERRRGQLKLHNLALGQGGASCKPGMVKTTCRIACECDGCDSSSKDCAVCGPGTADRHICANGATMFARNTKAEIEESADNNAIYITSSNENYRDSWGRMWLSVNEIAPDVGTCPAHDEYMKWLENGDETTGCSVKTDCKNFYNNKAVQCNVNGKWPSHAPNKWWYDDEVDSSISAEEMRNNGQQCDLWYRTNRRCWGGQCEGPCPRALPTAESDIGQWGVENVATTGWATEKKVWKSDIVRALYPSAQSWEKGGERKRGAMNQYIEDGPSNPNNKK